MQKITKEPNKCVECGEPTGTHLPGDITCMDCYRPKAKTRIKNKAGADLIELCSDDMRLLAEIELLTDEVDDEDMEIIFKLIMYRRRNGYEA